MSESKTEQMNNQEVAEDYEDDVDSADDDHLDDDEWIFDSLIGFLRGPVWTIPIVAFIEKKSVVFEPEMMETQESEYKKIYQEYKNLVDRLLGSHMDELNISEEKFELSCKKFSRKQRNKQSIKQIHRELFEQIWAANDFEIFKRFMVQRNIELQLQALELLCQHYGLASNLLQVDDKNSSPLSEYEWLRNEESLMQEVIKRSLAEDQLEAVDTPGEKVHKETPSAEIKENTENNSQEVQENVDGNEADDGLGKDEQIDPIVPDRIIEATIQEEKSKLEAQNQQEKVLLDQILKTKVLTPIQEKPEAVTSVQPNEQPVSANFNPLMDLNKEKLGTIDSEELKNRQEYLRKQRDKLIEVKRKEREKQLVKVEEKELLAKRPKSARLIRKLIDNQNGDSEDADDDDDADDGKDEQKEDDTIAFRRSLAERLKAEVVYNTKLN